MYFIYIFCILIKDFIRTHNVQTLDWPDDSPDLNPIENLWSIMKRKISHNKPSS